jgi:hypothetical protein
MIKTFLAVGVATVALTAGPTEARPHYTNMTKCQKWRHGECVKWKRMTRAEAGRAGYRVGYNFGPNYGYTSYGALPRTVVARYNLGRNYRYVNRDGYVYQVNPRTYRVVRVINWP